MGSRAQTATLLVAPLSGGDGFGCSRVNAAFPQGLLAQPFYGWGRDGR